MIINKTYVGFVVCILMCYLYLKFDFHNFMVEFSLFTKIIDAVFITISALAGLALCQALIYESIKNKGKNKNQ